MIKILALGWSALLLILTGCSTLSQLGLGRSPGARDPYLQAARGMGGSDTVVWEEAARWSFDDSGSLGAWPQPEGRWEPTSNAIEAVAGDRNRAILVASGFPGSVKIEFDATLKSVEEGRIGDITVLIGASDDKDFFRNGYALTTGSYFNHCSTIYRLGKPLANSEYSPLVANHTYHIKVVRQGNHLRYWLDDKIILEAWDPVPLLISGDSWVGIRTWKTRLTVDNIVISRPLG